MGGIAAALQASRLGVGVLVVEPSEWIGGQALAAGVSTMDDMSRQRSGLYLEYISRIKLHYDQWGKPMGTCYWDYRSTAFEPVVGRQFLYEMLSETKNSGKKALDILTFAEITQVKREGRTVVGVTVRDKNGTEKKIDCRVLIDATEYGDILPLVGVSYMAGNSATPFLNQEARIQDITWVAIIKSYPQGIPYNLRVRQPLPGYDKARHNFESYVTEDGMDFKGIYPVQLPVNFVSHNAYRSLPDSSTPWRYDGRRENWKYITKTGLNWGNDYPGKYGWNGRTGLPVSYLEDRELRAFVEKEAFIKTLHFIYYIQNELGESWSIADDEYYSTTLPDFANDLPEEWREIARRMPPIPYVRESRRLVGDYVLTSSALVRNSLSYRDGQTSHEFDDAIAIGGYILDLHGTTTDSDMEWDLGEKASYMNINRPRGPFQVPMRVMIPKNVDGFLVAEKNLSMSRLTAGALRLQPICMMVGQAAGALAAFSVKNNLQLREVSPVIVQSALLEAGVVLSLCKYSDVPPEHPYYNSVQLSNLHGFIEPLEPPHSPSYNISDMDDPVLAMAIIKGADKGIFGVDEILTHREMVFMLNKARAAAHISEGRLLKEEDLPDRFVSRGIFAEALHQAFGFDNKVEKNANMPRIDPAHRYAKAVGVLSSIGILDLYRMEKEFLPAHPITRGEAVEILMKAMTVERPKHSAKTRK